MRGVPITIGSTWQSVVSTANALKTTCHCEEERRGNLLSQPQTLSKLLVIARRNDVAICCLNRNRSQNYLSLRGGSTWQSVVSTATALKTTCHCEEEPRGNLLSQPQSLSKLLVIARRNDVAICCHNRKRSQNYLSLRGGTTCQSVVSTANALKTTCHCEEFR